MTSLVLALVLLVPIHPHTQAEQEAWVEQWKEKVTTKGSPSPKLMAEYVDFMERHLTQETGAGISPSSSGNREMGDNVEQWRGLVSVYFGSETDLALCVMAGESGGNPNAQNPRSSAAGLFQIVDFWWDKYGGDRYDPETNIRIASIIRDQQGWNAWTVYSRGECS